MSWYGLDSRSAETPKRLNILQRTLWLIASAFHCGITMMACFGLPGCDLDSGAGYHRAFTWSFSGYGVRTGEVNRRNWARSALPAAARRFISASWASVSGLTF